MENDSRKKVIDKIFDAALKERLSQLARKGLIDRSHNPLDEVNRKARYGRSGRRI
jgi:DNA-binding MarR family transcriptional regulator